MLALFMHILFILIIFTSRTYASVPKFDVEDQEKMSGITQEIICPLNEDDDLYNLAKLREKIEIVNSTTSEKIIDSISQKNIHPDDLNIAALETVMQVFTNLGDVPLDKNLDNKKAVIVMEGFSLINAAIARLKEYANWIQSSIDNQKKTELNFFEKLISKSKCIKEITIITEGLKKRPLLIKPHKKDLKSFKTPFKSKFIINHEWFEQFIYEEVILIRTFVRPITNPLDFQYFTHQSLNIILNFLKIIMEIDNEYKEFVTKNIPGTKEFNRYTTAESTPPSKSQINKNLQSLLTQDHQIKINQLKVEYEKKLKDQRHLTK